ncbi:MAG: hypothetical protein C0184_04225 [Chloroflexus aggregans]|uniref:YtxH domain-containing protein n=1 Tax=Chloroflexus aggregans TaxID=152260 RepID=A0A2J6X9Q3_9CHLR|nr:MAG: hypothetical protein C0184_04225 [Chloroflexus aggregans]
MDDLDAMIDSLIPRRTSGRRFWQGLLIGLLIGSGIATLFSPRSGPVLRALVAERMQAGLGQLRHALNGRQSL